MSTHVSAHRYLALSDGARAGPFPALNRHNMAGEIVIEVCIDMCVDMFIDVCIGACHNYIVMAYNSYGLYSYGMDMCVDIFIDLCIGACAGVCIDVCMEMCMLRARWRPALFRAKIM